MPVPASLKFQILTDVEGLSDAEQRLVSYHSDATNALKDIEKYWTRLSQTVGISAEEANRSLSDLTRGIQQAFQVLEKGEATRVVVDTSGLKLVVEDARLASNSLKDFFVKVADIQETLAQTKSVQLYSAYMQNLAVGFKTAHPAATKLHAEIDKWAASLTANAKNMVQANAITEQFKISLQKAAAPVEFQFKIEPEVVTSLKAVQGELSTTVSHISATSDQSQIMRRTLTGLSDVAKTAASEGLAPLSQQYKELRDLLADQRTLLATGQQIARITDFARTGKISLAEYASGLDKIAASGALSTQKFIPLRDSISNVVQEIKQREPYIAFARSLKEVSDAPDVKSMVDMRIKVAELLDVARRSNLTDLIQPLERLDSELAKGGGSIDDFRVKFRQLGEVSMQKVGMETIITESDKLAKAMESSGLDIDALVKSLHQISISPSAVKDLNSAEQQLATLGLRVSATQRAEINKFANSFDTVSSKIETATRTSAGLVEGIDKIRVTAAGKPVEIIHIDPEEQLKLKALNDELRDNVENVDKIDNSSMRLIELLNTVKQAASTAADSGLDPLADDFNRLFELLEERTSLQIVGTSLKIAADNAKTSTNSFDSLNTSLTTIIGSSDLAGTNLQGVRDALKSIQQQIVVRAGIVDVAEQLRKLAQAPDIKSVSQMREEISKLLATTRGVPGFENLNDVLERLVNEMASGSGKVEIFKHKMLQAADTAHEKIGFESVAKTIDSLSKELLETGTDVDQLTKSLRGLAVSPTTIKSLEDAGIKLGNITQAASIRGRAAMSSLNATFDATANKMSEGTKTGGGFVKQLSNIAFGAGGLTKHFTSWGQSITIALRSFGLFGAIYYSVRNVKNIVEAVSKTTFQLAENAAKIRDVETAFARLAREAGSSALIMAKIRDAAGGVIDRMELMGSATRAALAGLPVQRFDELVTGARALAAVTGREAPEALERLTNAIAKQERRLLDELGIVVRANDIYKDYAKKHNTTAQALSASQKQAAFFQATMAAVNEKILRLGGTIDTMQRPFLQFKAAWKDLEIATGSWLDKTLGISDIVRSTALGFRALSSSLIDSKDKAAASTAEYLSTVASIERLRNTIPRMIKEANNLTVTLKDHTLSVAATETANTRLKDITATLIGMFPNLATILKTDLKAGLAAAAEEAEKLEKRLLAIGRFQQIEAIQDLVKAHGDELKALKENKQIYSTLTTVYDNLMKSKDFATGLTQKELILLDKSISGGYANIFANIKSGKIYEILTASLSKYGAKLGTSQSAMESLTIQSAELINSQIRLGNIMKEVVSTFLTAKIGSKEYTLALGEVNKAVPISGKYLESMRDELAAFIKLEDESGKKGPKSIEEITDALKAEAAEWEKSIKTFKETTITPETDVSKAKSELGTLETVVRALYSKAVEETKDYGVTNRNTLENVVSDWQQYLAEKALSGSSMAATEKRLSVKALEDTRTNLETRINLLGLTTEAVELLAKTEVDANKQRQELTRLEREENEKKVKEMIDDADTEKRTDEEITDSKIQQIERGITALKKAYEEAKKDGRINDQTQQLFNKREAVLRTSLLSAQRAEHKKTLKEQLDLQLSALRIIASITPKLIGISTDEAISLLTELENNISDIAPEFKDVADKIRDVLSNAAEHGAKVNWETAKEIQDSLVEQLNAKQKTSQEMVKEDAAYADLAKALTDESIKIRKSQSEIDLKLASKHNDMLFKIEEARIDVVKSNSLKEIDTANDKLAKMYEQNQEWLAGNDEINSALIDYSRFTATKITELRFVETQKMLKKIADETDIAKLDSMISEMKIEEIGIQNMNAVREKYNLRRKKLLGEDVKNVEDLVAKENSIELVAETERIQHDRDERNTKIDNLISIAKVHGENTKEIERLEIARTFNTKFAEDQIAKAKSDNEKKMLAEKLKYMKKTAENELEAAKLRLEMDFNTWISILERERGGWSFKAAIAEKGSQEEIEAINEVNEADKTIAEAKQRRDSAVQDEITDYNRKSVEERAGKMKDLADYVGATTIAALEISRDAMRAERDAKLEQLNSLRLSEDESAKYGNEILKSYNQQLAESEQAIWRARIENATFGVSKIVDICKEALRTLSDFTSESTADTINTMVSGYEQAGEAITSSLAAYSMPSPQTIAMAAQSWLKLASTVVGYFTRQKEREQVAYEKEITKKLENIHSLSELKRLKTSINYTKLSIEQREKLEKEFNDRMESATDQLAGQMASDMAEAIASGLDIPFETLMMNWVKAMAVAEIGAMLKPLLAPYFDTIKTEVGLLLNPKKVTAELDRLEGEERAKRAKEAVPFKAAYEMYGLAEQQAIKDRDAAIKRNAKLEAQVYQGKVDTYHKLGADAKKSYEASSLFDEASIKATAERQYAEQHGEKVAKEAFEGMANEVKTLEPALRGGTEGLKNVAGDWTTALDDLSEQIPAATFRAVTEPQANEILVLLGRQTDLLTTIAANTTTLANRERQEKPQANNVNAAPSINDQNININERLDITINGEAIMEVSRPEDLNIENLATRLSEYQQALIDQREVALGRSKLRTRRLR